MTEDPYFIPPPPKEIANYQKEHPLFADVIGAHTVITRDRETKHVITLGYTETDRPTHPQQKSTEFHTITVADAENIRVDEVSDALFLPFGRPDLMRSFAVRIHSLITYSYQLVDITSEINRGLGELFRTASLDAPEDVERVVGEARGIIRGDLIISQPLVTKADLKNSLGIS